MLLKGERKGAATPSTNSPTILIDAWETEIYMEASIAVKVTMREPSFQHLDARHARPGMRSFLDARASTRL